MKKPRAALLGSAGAVGRRYISMRHGHHFSELEVLMGRRSAGTAIRTVELMESQRYLGRSG